MLRVIPEGWFSYDFTVFDRGGRPSPGWTYRTGARPRS